MRGCLAWIPFTSPTSLLFPPPLFPPHCFHLLFLLRLEPVRPGPNYPPLAPPLSPAAPPLSPIRPEPVRPGHPPPHHTPSPLIGLSQSDLDNPPLERVLQLLSSPTEQLTELSAALAAVASGGRGSSSRGAASQEVWGVGA